MLLKNRIKKIAMTLTSGQNIHLFILLCADGSIQRMGSGHLESLETEMVSGEIGADLFYNIMALIPETMTKQGGVFEAPERRGSICELDLVFADRMEKEIVGYRFIYGSQSLGLPEEIKALLEGILQQTDIWYRSMLKMQQKKKKRN